MDVSPDTALEFERRKLEIEERRVANEEKQGQGWRAFVPALAIATPIVVVLLTLGYQLRASNEQGKRDFELTAAEIVMNADNPVATYNKARALSTLFPDRLPGDFANSFEPSQFTDSPEDVTRDTLRNLLLERPAEAFEILRIWIAFRPEDEPLLREIAERLE